LAQRSSLFVATRRRDAKARGKALAGTYELWFRERYNLPPTDPRFLAMSEEDIEAEWWAFHYQESKASVEFDDDDENASEDYLAQITREAEEEEARAAAEAASGGATQPEADPDDWGPEE
jgi:hypothetical protein